MAFIFISLGAYLGYVYVNLKKDVIVQKEQFIELNNKYSYQAIVHVDKCMIDLEHNKNEIIVHSEMVVSNNNKESLDTLLFSLNPELKISSIEINSNPVEFIREQHIIRVPLTQ